MKKLRITSEEILNLSMLTNKQYEWFMKKKLENAGFDLKGIISSHDDPETNSIIYTQKEDGDE